MMCEKKIRSEFSVSPSARCPARPQKNWPAFPSDQRCCEHVLEGHRNTATLNCPNAQMSTAGLVASMTALVPDLEKRILRMCAIRSLSEQSFESSKTVRCERCPDRPAATHNVVHTQMLPEIFNGCRASPRMSRLRPRRRCCPSTRQEDQSLKRARRTQTFVHRLSNLVRSRFGVRAQRSERQGGFDGEGCAGWWTDNEENVKVALRRVEEPLPGCQRSH